MKIGTNIIGKNNVTATLSNIGVINLPDEIKSYIDRFEIIPYADKLLPLKVGMCSFDDKLSITFVSTINDREIQRNFFKFLSNQGIDVNISYSLSEYKPKKVKLSEADEDEIL